MGRSDDWRKRTISLENPLERVRDGLQCIPQRKVASDEGTDVASVVTGRKAD